MTKNPRDHREWTNVELQHDSAGYLAAQKAYHEDQAKAREEAFYKDDLRRFTQAFVAAGGEAKDAERAFKASRNEQAAEAARAVGQSAEQAAQEYTRRIATERI